MTLDLLTYLCQCHANECGLTGRDREDVIKSPLVATLREILRKNPPQAATYAGAGIGLRLRDGTVVSVVDPESVTAGLTAAAAYRNLQPTKSMSFTGINYDGAATAAFAVPLVKSPPP
jgi:hypothetical protein